MIQIYHSNNLNKITDSFITLINKEKLNPLESEVVVVQTEGLKKWLSLKIAKINNICMNVKFFTPRDFVYELLKLRGLNFSEEYVFEKNNLFWIILNILLENTEEFGNLSTYIKDGKINNSDFNEVKLAQIVSVVVDLFDQYFTYRPTLIDNWEKGKEECNNTDEHWQFLLFRKICENVKVKSFPASVLEELKKPHNVNNKKFYKRVSFFAISVLPPFYLDILYYFAPSLNMYMFLLNPSSDYWYMDISEEVGTRISLNKGVDANKLYYSVKKNLLTDFGKLGKVFFSNLFAQSDHIVNVNECFDNNAESKSMLDIIKKDILLNNDLNEVEKHIVDENDYSIEIHSCYSPMREVETLYNRLLNIFENDPNISAGDVLVMTPDISKYTPYINATFGYQKESNKYIPYAISDVNCLDDSTIIQVFMDILLLVRGRYSASDIFNLIQFEGIRKKFKLNESDIEILRICIEESGIRWGWDETYRGEEGLIKDKLYSWEYGIERLLLSFIYENDELYNNILVINGIELSIRETVSALIEFIHILYDFYLFSKKKHRFSEWTEKFESLINSIFEEDGEYIKDIEMLISTLYRINKAYENYELSNPPICVGIDFVIEYLKECLSKKRQFHRFLDGNVNFCEMIPMRSIPFDVICIIGLNDDTFPRKKKPLSFDLMAQYPKEGDRDLRENDKYLFLETIISASKKLYLSYVGQDIITNEELPPSVLVKQFLYNISERFVFSDKNLKLEDRLVFKHPLFSFDKKYFLKNAGDIYINYSDDDYLAVLSKSKANEDVAYKENFINLGKEIDVRIDENIININDLLTFFANPIEYFFRKTLAISLDDKAFVVSDKEPFELGLDKYNIKTAIIDEFFNHTIKTNIHNIKSYVYKFTSVLPPGGVGSAEIKETIGDAKAFLLQMNNFLDISERQSYEVIFDVNDYRVEGVLKYFHKMKYSDTESILLKGLENYNLAYYRPTRLKVKDKIYTWIKHVIFNYFEIYNQKKPSHSFYFGWKKESDGYTMERIVFKPCDNKNVKDQFSFLLDTYLKGIKKPIHFYPEASDAYYNKKDYKTIFTNFIEDTNYGFNKRDVYLAFYVKHFDKYCDFFNEEFYYLADTIFNFIEGSVKELNGGE